MWGQQNRIQEIEFIIQTLSSEFDESTSEQKQKIIERLRNLR